MDSTTQAGNGSAATQERGTVTNDTESTTLIRTIKAFDALDESARARIMEYLNSRYGS